VAYFNTLCESRTQSRFAFGQKSNPRFGRSLAFVLANFGSGSHRWKTRINRNYVSRNEAGLEEQHRLATLRRTGTMSPRVIGAPDYHSCSPSLDVSFGACQTHAGADWCDRKLCSSRPPWIRWSSPVDVFQLLGRASVPCWFCKCPCILLDLHHLILYFCEGAPPPLVDCSLHLFSRGNISYSFVPKQALSLCLHSFGNSSTHLRTVVHITSRHGFDDGEESVQLVR